jgi:hypothetical protein
VKRTVVVRDGRGRFRKSLGFNVTVLRHSTNDFDEGSLELELLLSAFALIRSARLYCEAIK